MKATYIQVLPRVVDAEQFLYTAGGNGVCIPKGVYHDGKNWVISTKSGTAFVFDGDYILTSGGEQSRMSREDFEKHYKKL